MKMIFPLKEQTEFLVFLLFLTDDVHYWILLYQRVDDAIGI